LIIFTRYYHANVDETRRKIKELIKEGEWNSDEFPKMKQNLLNKLNIQDKSEQELLDMLKQKLDEHGQKLNEISNAHKAYKPDEISNNTQKSYNDMFF